MICRHDRRFDETRPNGGIGWQRLESAGKASGCVPAGHGPYGHCPHLPPPWPAVIKRSHSNQNDSLIKETAA